MEELFEVTPENLAPYFLGRKRHKEYNSALDLYNHMAFHMDGYFLTPNPDRTLQSSIEQSSDNQNTNPYFSRLIDARRPSESDTIGAYRRTIYLPLTQSTCYKVYNSLRKIVKSADFKIDYTKSLKPTNIADGEYLADYCEIKYPVFNSVENWFYNYGLKQMLIDSNALVYVLPKSFEIEEKELFEPVATVVHCKDLYGYKENEYAIFKLDKEWRYLTSSAGGKKTYRDGKILGCITRFGYWEIRQISSKQDFEIVEIMKFTDEAVDEPGMKYMPAWLIGGVHKKITKDYILYNSFMAPMLAGLDAMARESSDADAEVVQHVYSTMWYYAAQDCRVCMGSGRVNGKGKQSVTCSTCNGTGGMPKSPYRDMVINSDPTKQVSNPPAGYVTKPTDIVKLFAERLKAHEWNSLSSINHEFLAETPLVQSGVAKQYDRQELENYTYSVAYRMTEVLNDVYYFINEFRYSTLVPNSIEREKMLPEIPVPTKYDLLTESILEQQLKSLMDAKADPEIIDQTEQEYIAKKFPNEHELRDKMKSKKMLDPFPRMTTQEKQDLLLSKIADPVDVVVSLYIHPFIEQAFVEFPSKDGKDGFCDKEFQEQKDIIYGYAKEKVDTIDAANKIKEKAAMDKLKATTAIGAKPIIN